MLFACSIENTMIALGVFAGDNLVFNAEIHADIDKSVDEYAVLFHSLFAIHQVETSSINGAIVASVVRPLTSAVCQAVERLIHIKPLLIGPGVKTGLNIKTDIPSQVGADIVANAVAANALNPSPMVIVDFGVATTLTGINAGGELCGVAICPGVRLSLDALSGQAADLPGIALDNPKHLLGRNTIDSMVSGIVHGHAAMIDGLLDRIADEWHAERLTVIACGSFAETITAYCRSRHDIRYVPHLTLFGLRRIFTLNSRTKSPAAESASIPI